jgi:glycosyltransferase involved in cell wall biosynthesis
VVFPLEGLGRFGGIRVVCDIASALAEAGYPVTLRVPDFASEVPFPLAGAVRLEVVPTGAGTHRVRQLRWFGWLAAHACRDAGVVVATSWRIPWLVASSRLGRRPAPRVVHLLQGDDIESLIVQGRRRGPLRWAMHGMALGSLRLPAERVAVSRWVAERNGHPEATVLPNGVDPARFFPPREARAQGRLRLGAVARPGGSKGWPDLVAALDRLVAAFAAEALDVVLASGEDLAPHLPPALAPRITLVQPVGDDAMRAFYQSLDVFVFPSRAEGFGLPPLEAMACGVPVVTTECGGVRAYADDTCARLVPVGDDAAIAAAADALLRDPAARRALASRGIEVAARHSLAHSMARWVTWLDTLTGAPGTAGGTGHG